MNAPPWPVNPGIGQWFGNWIWSGSQWLASPTTGMRVLTQIFAQSGSYTPSPGLVSLVVECIGGGGAGGGASIGQQAGYWSSAGGGGGSGGYSRKTLPAALVRGGVPVTIGDGAISPGGGAQPYGGDTSFGALCVAKGGQTGMGNAIAGGVYGIGGLGAPAGIGDIAFPGNSGATGAYIGYPAAQANALTGGMGGSMWGGASDVTIANWESVANGAAGAPNTGAGGQGGIANQPLDANEGASGGAGGSGICIVTETCWGDVDQPQPRPPAIDVNLRPWPQPPWPPGGPWPPGWPPPPGPWPRSEDDC